MKFSTNLPESRIIEITNHSTSFFEILPLAILAEIKPRTRRVTTTVNTLNISTAAALVLALDAYPAGLVPTEWPVRETAERLDHALRAGAELRLIVQGRAAAGALCCAARGSPRSSAAPRASVR